MPSICGGSEMLSRGFAESTAVLDGDYVRFRVDRTMQRRAMKENWGDVEMGANIQSRCSCDKLLASAGTLKVYWSPAGECSVVECRSTCTKVLT